MATWHADLRREIDRLKYEDYSGDPATAEVQVSPGGQVAIHLLWLTATVNARPTAGIGPGYLMLHRVSIDEDMGTLVFLVRRDIALNYLGPSTPIYRCADFNEF